MFGQGDGKVSNLGLSDIAKALGGAGKVAELVDSDHKGIRAFLMEMDVLRDDEDERVSILIAEIRPKLLKLKRILEERGEVV